MLHDGKVNRTLKDGIIISTVKPPFMAWYGKYETAISFDNQETWSIAEGYETFEKAVEGHDKYALMSKEELENKTDWLD